MQPPIDVPSLADAMDKIPSFPFSAARQKTPVSVFTKTLFSDAANVRGMMASPARGLHCHRSDRS